MKRSKFSLSHYRLLTCNMGYLVPIGLVEVLPGDTFQHSTSLLIRCNPLVAPVMHPVHAKVHHWFVPHRLVWDSWEKFITGGPDGLDASSFPTITFGSGTSESTLSDYLGIPPTGASVTVSALPFRAYDLIFNEWYRDQDLVTPLTISKASGADSTTNTTLQRVAWEKDYFTTARPWTQKGPQVSVPVGGNVKGIGWPDSSPMTVGTSPATRQSGDTSTSTLSPAYGAVNTGNLYIKGKTAATGAYPDITLSGTMAVNDLRLAMALQRYEEARARYGSRYTEYLRYLGVRSSDARLQRPEYLGGGKQTIQFSEVLQTGVTTGGSTAGVGNLKGHGIGALRSNRYRRFFEEHGYVVSLLNVKPRTMYAQQLLRHWNRRVKEDFYQRELAHIGQQEILNKEVYIADPSPNGVFGYQDRYDEYRRQESGIAGAFHTTLNYWHMARISASPYVLNSSFVQANPTNRIFADQTGADQLLIMGMHSLQARRLMSAVGTSFIK